MGYDEKLQLKGEYGGKGGNLAIQKSKAMQQIRQGKKLAKIEMEDKSAYDLFMTPHQFAGDDDYNPQAKKMITQGKKGKSKGYRRKF